MSDALRLPTRSSSCNDLDPDAAAFMALAALKHFSFKF
jgi:hypothetical protein